MHVEHVQVAPDGVAQLPEADRQRVAVAGDADVRQVAVGGVGAGGDRRHAAVRRVEAVRAAHEVGRRLRRAADARQLGDQVRRRIQLAEGAHDGRGDRVVPAAGAQGRHRALVVAHGQAESSFWSAATRMDDRCGFLVIVASCRVPPARRSVSAVMPSSTWRAAAGSRRRPAPSAASPSARWSPASAACAAARRGSARRRRCARATPGTPRRRRRTGSRARACSRR